MRQVFLALGILISGGALSENSKPHVAELFSSTTRDMRFLGEAGPQPNSREFAFHSENALPALFKNFPGLSEAISKGEKYTLKKQFATPAGKVLLVAFYVPESKRVFFTLVDFDKPGTVLRIDLNDRGNPRSIASIDDPERVFSYIFGALRVPDIGEAIGKGTSEDQELRITKIRVSNTRAGD